MSFVVAFCCLHIPILFSKSLCIICRKEAFFIVLQYFYICYYFTLVSTNAPLTAKSALVLWYKNFFLHGFLSRIKYISVFSFCFGFFLPSSLCYGG